MADCMNHWSDEEVGGGSGEGCTHSGDSALENFYYGMQSCKWVHARVQVPVCGHMH